MAGDAISPIIEQINKIPKSYNLCRAFNRSAVLLFRIHRFILTPKKSLEKKKRTPFLYQSSFFSSVVEVIGLEPMTSCM